MMYIVHNYIQQKNRLIVQWKDMRPVFNETKL